VLNKRQEKNGFSRQATTYRLQFPQIYGLFRPNLNTETCFADRTFGSKSKTPVNFISKELLRRPAARRLLENNKR